jgi:hypothetical protein
MESFLQDESTIFDNRLASINVEFMEAIASYLEELEGTLFFEKTKERPEPITVKFNKFIADIINSLQNLKSQIQLEVDRKIRSAEIDNKLRKLHKEMKEKQSSGVSEVEVIDCWTLRDKYLECVNDLKKYAKKFSEMKYTRTSDIDNDLAEFNSKVDSYSKEIEELTNKKIKVPINKMIDFVEDEISGRSRILVSLDDAVTIFKQMQQDAKVIETRKDILGPDIIPKHMGLLRKVSVKISSFIKRWVVKIISTVVFIIG